MNAVSSLINQLQNTNKDHKNYPGGPGGYINVTKERKKLDTLRNT